MLSILLKILGVVAILFVGFWALLILDWVIQGRYGKSFLKWLANPWKLGPASLGLHVTLTVLLATAAVLIWKVILDRSAGATRMLLEGAFTGLSLEALAWARHRWGRVSDRSYRAVAGWRIEPKIDPAEAHHAITSEDGSTALLLTDTAIVVQASDPDQSKGPGQGFDRDRRTGRSLKKLLGSALSGLNLWRDRGLTLPLSAIEDVEYRDGQLVITGPDGEATFADMPLAEKALKRAMEQFSEADARSFADRVREAAARSRAP